MTGPRGKKFYEVVQRRQPDMTVIFENIWDPHNISAVLRTCDSVGIFNVYVLYTEPGLQERGLFLGKRSSKGTRKWMNTFLYHDLDKCFQAVKKSYHRIFAAHWGPSSVSLHSLDFTAPFALVFGNERDGLSQQALAHCDGSFIIPQMGMAESLNLSVACAVSLYEAFRQRQLKGFYDQNLPLSEAEQQTLLEDYLDRNEHGVKERIFFCE